jgi:CHAT domain
VLPRREARELYRLLLGPAEKRIDAAERLVLLPDEMLARLPFGALIRGESNLEKQKAIETATSASAWLAAKPTAPSSEGGRGTKGE